MLVDKIFYNNPNFTPWLNTKEYIVLHHTWKVWDWNIKYLSWQVGNVSCHYMIRQNWEIIQFLDDDKIWWHCWKSKREWKTWINKYSIWIEIESDWKTFTDIQKTKLHELIVFLSQKYGVVTQKIIRHKDIAPSRKIDPWDNLWALKYSNFEKYQRSFIKFNKSMNFILKRLLNYSIKYLKQSWAKSENLQEQKSIHNLADEIRFFISRYK